MYVCVCVHVLIAPSFLSRMSKRARPSDDSERPIPPWLARSGIEPRALRQLMDWMEAKELCFFPVDKLAHDDHEKSRFKHPVSPHYTTSHYGVEPLLFCEHCAPWCECCGGVGRDLAGPADLDKPHDLICSECSRSQCEHADDYDAWPDYCIGCERGCRESTERTVGGVKTHVCERCDEEQ